MSSTLRFVHIVIAVAFCNCFYNAESTALTSKPIVLREFADIKSEKQLEVEQELVVIQRQLLDHHWGYFIPGIFPTVRAKVVPMEKCSETATGRVVCTIEKKVYEVVTFQARPKKGDAPVNVTESGIVAKHLTDAGVPYNVTEDGLYFEAIPSGVSIEPLPSGVSLDDYKYHSH